MAYILTLNLSFESKSFAIKWSWFTENFGCTFSTNLPNSDIYLEHSLDGGQNEELYFLKYRGILKLGFWRRTITSISGKRNIRWSRIVSLIIKFSISWSWRSSIRVIFSLTITIKLLDFSRGLEIECDMESNNFLNFSESLTCIYNVKNSLKDKIEAAQLDRFDFCMLWISWMNLMVILIENKK